jgi:Skp family chaperone for outer membrane proteins
MPDGANPTEQRSTRVLIGIGVAVGIVAGVALALLAVQVFGATGVGKARRIRRQLLEDAERDAEALRREAELAAREQALAAREAELAAREAEQPAEPEPAFELPPVEESDDSEALEVLLAELQEAEQAFATTRAELAQRSEELAEREAALAARERTFAAGAPPEPQELRPPERPANGRRGPGPPSFSSGLRALEERGLRGGRRPA